MVTGSGLYDRYHCEGNGENGSYLMQLRNKFSSKRRHVFQIFWWFETRSFKFRYFRTKTVEGRVSLAKILRKAKTCDGGNGSLGFLLIASKCFHDFPEAATSESFSADFYFYYLFSLNWVHSVWPRCYVIYWSPNLFVWHFSSSPGSRDFFDRASSLSSAVRRIRRAPTLRICAAVVESLCASRFD